MAFSGREATEEFVKLPRAWGAAYQHKVTAAIVIRRVQMPFLLIGRVFCTPNLPAGYDLPVRVETEHILGVRETSRFVAGAEDWLEKATTQGAIEVSGELHHVLQRSGNTH